MNNKFPVVSLLLFIVCFAGAVYLSVAPSQLPELRGKMYTGVQQQLKHVFIPVAGLEKFYADAQWVAMVQRMADSSVVKKSDKKMSEEEEKAIRVAHAKVLYKQLDRLSDMDPNNEKFYEIGAMFLSNDIPNESMELLKKGDRLLKTPSYRYPFNQYCILNNVISSNDDAKRAANRPQMIELLGIAMDRSGAPDFIQNQWLRLQAEAKGYDDDTIGRLRLWRDYYVSKAKASATENGANGKPGSVSADSEYSYDGFSATERGVALLNQIMNMAHNMAVDNFKKRQTAKGDALKKLQAEHKEISDIFFSVAPSGHYSKESLHSYEAGDLFDVYTGTPVTPYGVDPDMLQKGKIVVYKGAYSQATGKPRKEDYSKFKHADFLNAAGIK